MSERASMKRRVRGLLRLNRGKPLLALLLASLPMLVVTIITTFFMDPLWAGIVSLFTQIQTIITEQDIEFVFLTILAKNPLPLDFSSIIASFPSSAIYLGAYLFIGMPIAVSTSGYLLGFLRGKETKIYDVFSCFTHRYPRVLGGMLYKQLWVLIWLCAIITVPVMLGIISIRIVEVYAVQLSFNSVYFYVGIMGVCVVLFIILLILLVNRLLAYALTATCIAAQPRLSPFRAVGLSRKLMRGQKGSLVSLYASFTNFYIPALLCAILLPLLPSIVSLLQLEEGIVSVLQMGLYIVVGVNLLVTLYVMPYFELSIRAFYIERKREALLDEELTPDDFASQQVRM